MLTLEQRNELSQGIGASESAAILGLDPYRTPYELWLEKTGRIEKDLSKNDAVIMGNLLEPVIAKRYAELHSCKVARVNRAIRHKDHPHILCHLDRKIVGQRKVVEIKTANPFSTAWGDAGTDEVPPNYIIQVQHQLACTGYEEADLIVFRGTTDLRTYPFKRDPDIIDVIIDQVNHFWKYHILGDNPPEPTTRADLKHMFPMNNGKFIPATDAILATVTQYHATKAELKTVEQAKLALEKIIAQEIGANNGIKLDDQIIATLLADKNGTRRLSIKGGK